MQVSEAFVSEVVDDRRLVSLDHVNELAFDNSDNLLPIFNHA